MRSKLTLIAIIVLIGGPLIVVAYMFSLGAITEGIIAWAVLMAIVWFIVQIINGLKARNTPTSEDDPEH